MHVSGNVSTHRTAAVALVSAAALLPAIAQGAPATASATGLTPSSAVQALAAAGADGPPAVKVTTLVSGLSFPWDVAFTPDHGLLVTERGGRILRRSPNGTVAPVSAAQADLFVGSEAGQMGIAVDPGFSGNRRFYTCQAYRGSGTSPVDIRVLRWTLSPDSRSAARTGSPVLTGLPISTGRHAGCRLRFAPDGTLHVGTGDAAVGTHPQDLTSLGGKTLRVNPDGSAPTDNPFAARGGRSAYVWTYGHRNVQGLAVRPGTTQVWSAEHGTDRDDEVNQLVRGGNYGWDPVPGYDESTPMTDLAKFPSAVRARWTSGSPTVATSGLTFLLGSGWGQWEGALAVAELKGAGMRILALTPDGRVRADSQVAALDGTYGRLRAAQLGPDGALYVTTSNGGGTDRVLRVASTAAPTPYRAGLDVSPSGVSAIAQGNLVTVFARGTDGRVRYTRQSSPGGAWSAWQAIPGVVGSAPSATTWDGSRIDVVARSTTGQLVHTWTVGHGWQPWRTHDGTLTTAPTIVATGPGTADLVVRTTRDALSHRRLVNGTWGPWAGIGGTVTSAAALRADRATGQVVVTVRGTGGYVHDEVIGPRGVVRGWRTVVRHTWSAPAVSATGPDLLVTRNGQTPVLARGGPVQALGGDLTGAPAVVTRPDGTWQVAGRSLDGALYVYDGRTGTQRWTRVGGSLG